MSKHPDKSWQVVDADQFTRFVKSYDGNWSLSSTNHNGWPLRTFTDRDTGERIAYETIDERTGNMTRYVFAKQTQYSGGKVVKSAAQAAPVPPLTRKASP